MFRERTKCYRYVNDIGIPKLLYVTKRRFKKLYLVTIYDGVHGEFCGSNVLTKDDLDVFLKHYHII